MSNDQYTPEEIAAMPQTQQVFDKAPLVFGEHQWQQQGYFITDICSPSRPDCHPGGIPIPSGSMLVKNKEGVYGLVDEQTRKSL